MERFIKIKRPFLAAGVFSLVVLFISWAYLQIKVQALRAYREPVQILVAKQDLPRGEVLDEAWVETVAIPRQFLQPGVLTSPAEVNGMVAASPILQGEQISATKLLAPGAGTGLAIHIPDGMRALSLKVDAASEVSGLIRPNNFVDVLATFEMEEVTGDLKIATYTIVRRAQVLSVGKDLGFIPPKIKSKGKFSMEDFQREEKTVTLALTPEQAQRVALAADQGRVVLALRPQREEEESAIAPASLSELTGIEGRGRQERFREYRGK